MGALGSLCKVKARQPSGSVRLRAVKGPAVVSAAETGSGSACPYVPEEEQSERRRTPVATHLEFRLEERLQSGAGRDHPPQRRGAVPSRGTKRAAAELLRAGAAGGGCRSGVRLHGPGAGGCGGEHLVCCSGVASYELLGDSSASLIAAFAACAKTTERDTMLTYLLQDLVYPSLCARVGSACASKGADSLFAGRGPARSGAVR